MAKVAGVRFRGSGKIYWFDPGEFTLRQGSHVIVETARGMEYGTVSGPLRELPDDKVSQPLRSIVRVASEEDEARAAANHQKEREAFAICKEKIRRHELDMKLIDAEYTFDNNKILFYFTADGRVDFRELVKDLAGVFRTRIELRQIGVRDETKILGGIGICGRPLCCHTYLTDFVPVSIKMAKEQNLSLNPTKISGVCGRLMCCLKNEEETYEYLNSKLPAIGDTVTTPSGAIGEVTQVSVLRQKVRVVIMENDEKEVREFDAEELEFTPRKGGRGRRDGHRDAARGRSRERREERREDGREKREDRRDDGREKREERRDESREKRDGRREERSDVKRENRDGRDVRGEEQTQPSQSRAEGAEKSYRSRRNRHNRRDRERHEGGEGHASGESREKAGQTGSGDGIGQSEHVGGGSAEHTAHAGGDGQHES